MNKLRVLLIAVLAVLGLTRMAAAQEVWLQIEALPSLTEAEDRARAYAAIFPDVAVIQVAQPIGFDAPDEQPVSLLIFLLVPEAATQKHLEILSEIAEMLSDASLRDKMMASGSALDLFGLISNWQSSQLA